jgi:hypothetical protein
MAKTSIKDSRIGALETSGKGSAVVVVAVSE